MYDLTKQTAYVCALVCACSVPNRSNIIVISSRQNSTYIVAPDKERFFSFFFYFSLRKLAYSNIVKVLQLKKEIFQIKIFDIFHISPQNIDCGYSLEPPRRGGSNEYPSIYVLGRNKKNNVYPFKPQFYYINVGFKGVKLT